MLRQRHETRLDRPMAESFEALVNVVARGRWATKLVLGPPEALPRSGASYEQQRGSVLRRGRVLECIKPVSITLHETLLDPPCCVRLRLRWRLDPLDAGTHLRLEAGYDLNGAAALRRRHWSGRISAHCRRMIDAVQSSLDAMRPEADAQDNGVSGQNTGSNSITARKISTVNGTPTFK